MRQLRPTATVPRQLLCLLLLALPCLLALEQFSSAAGPQDVSMGASLPLVMEGAGKRLSLGGQTFAPEHKAVQVALLAPRQASFARPGLPAPIFESARSLWERLGQRKLEGG